MKKIFTLLIALLFFGGGLFLTYTGLAYQRPFGGFNTSFPYAPKEFANTVQKHYQSSPLKAQGDLLKFESSGLMLVLVPPGGVLVLLALILGFVGIRMKMPPPKPPEEEESSGLTLPGHEDEMVDISEFGSTEGKDLEEDEEAKKEEDKDKLTESVAKKKQTEFLIPKHLLDDDYDDENMFYDVQRVVALTQTTMPDKLFGVVVEVLRPKFLPFVEGFEEAVRSRLARQILHHHMLRLKREEDNISPDQFTLQDKRMREAERETIFRRFMPKEMDELAPEAHKIVGKVFELNEQQKMQQFTLSQAEDWQDLSLRNFVEMMEQKTILEAEAE